MKTLVYFSAAARRYAVPVEATVAVRSAAALVPLPSATDGVIGMLPEDPPLSVLDVLGSDGRQILVLESRGVRFGLLVEHVAGLRRVDETTIGAGPPGLDRGLITGVINDGAGVIMIADPAGLAVAL
jgi:chemotaxis signal transduction protein